LKSVIRPHARVQATNEGGWGDGAHMRAAVRAGRGSHAHVRAAVPRALVVGVDGGGGMRACVGATHVGFACGTRDIMLFIY
jgi:hypothetical protein